MHALLIALLAASAAPKPSAANVDPAPGAFQEEVDPVLDAYRELGSARDPDALGRLWLENPTRVLSTFDSDLERSLGLLEDAERQAGDAEGFEPDAETAAEIARLQARAVFAARIAAERLDRPLLLDYAVSFAHWDREQQRSFRGGQQAFGAARRALNAGELEQAAAEARRCHELAEPLGDWWGTAMGRSLAAQVALAREDHEQALLESARARTLNHGLGLTSSEAGNLLVMGEAALALGQRERAAEAARAGLELSPEGSTRREALADLARRAQ